MRPIGCVSMLKQENPWRLSYRETMTMIQNPEIWRIRKRIWDLIEARNIAQFPQPVHHRIPNFICASIADKKLNMLEVSLKAECVKLNPDTPQKQVRFLTLHGGFDTAHVAARAYDYVIKFQGLDVDIIFNISDYEEDAKQGGPHLSLFCQKRRAEISALISCELL